MSVWTLTGAPSGWSAQLEALFAKKPPFAVISGAAGDDWAVVDEFCERKQLPCVRPVADLPRMATGGFFNLCYSEGVRLDARVTASSVKQGWDESAGKILLVHNDDARGQAAREAFMSAWPDPGAGVAATAIAADAALSSREWRDLLARERPAVLIAWIAPAQLQSLITMTAGQPSLPPRIYTAASFTDWTALKAPQDCERRVLHVYPYNLPPHGLAQFPREQVWLKSQGLGDLAMPAAAEALFACHAVGEAMLGMTNN